MRKMTVLSVAYPFAPVTADPVGGAEQILARLDRALADAGHRSIVIAPEGSAVAGELRPIAAAALITDAVRGAIHAQVRHRIAEAIARDRPDAIHLHGLDFHSYLPADGPPVLVTLHLPLEWYPVEALQPARGDVFLHPVSDNQALRAPAGARLSLSIANGVEMCESKARKSCFALILGRVCREKGFDDALEACRRADVPLLMAGAVFPYPDHQAFFRDHVETRLDRRRRWIGAVAGRSKQRLLAKACCLLVPSKVPETSSLVAMEALAAGTPVIAYRIGALPEIVEDGRTGLLVDTVDEMAAAIPRAAALDPEQCRAAARVRFPLEAMTHAYFARYAALAGG